MARKHKKIEVKRAPTKRELSRWQRQRKIQRIITITGMAFIAIIIGFIGYGYYAEQVKPFNQAVLKVNDRTFNMNYYLKTLQLYILGGDSSRIALLADMAIGRLETNELIRQGAPELGVTVSNDEVKAIINRVNIPDDEITRDIISGELLLDKTVNEYFASKIPASCEQAHVQAMFLGSKKTAEEIAAKLASGDNFTALAMQFSEEPMTRTKGGDLGWLPKGYSKLLLGGLGDSLIEEIVFSIEPQTVSQPVFDKSINKKLGYWIVEVLEKNDRDGTHARGILLSTEEEANEIKDKLQHGADFATLVRNHSLHEQTKKLDGDLGWIQQTSWYQEGKPMEALAKEVPSLEVGIISEPIVDRKVETSGGYWLIRVLEKDSRSLDANTADKIKNKSFETWLDEQRAKSRIENLLDAEKKAWALAQIRKNAKRQGQLK